MQFDCLSDIHLESFLKVGTQKFMSYWEKVLSSQASDVLLIAGVKRTNLSPEKTTKITQP